MSSLPPPADEHSPSQNPPPHGAMRCPRCSALVAPEQDWCLECGAPARTRLAPTPNWRLPVAAVVAIVALSGALLAFAFVKLTGDDTATSSQTAPVVAPQPAVTPTAATPAPAPSLATKTATSPGKAAKNTPGSATATSPKQEKRQP